MITGNTLGGAGTAGLGRAGIYVGFDDGTLVTNNTVVNVPGATTLNDSIGIGLGTSAVSATAFTVQDVANVTVTGNVIGSVVEIDTYSAVGISARNDQLRHQPDRQQFSLRRGVQRHCGRHLRRHLHRFRGHDLLHHADLLQLGLHDRCP